ncbi:MAG: hypothetical protein WC476_04480 [Phycisphaerae bacterium]|jgi:predicted O-linked N-acetylglucosamine transferase (SPINDLY family)
MQKDVFKNMPRFIIKANAAIESGKITEAADFLNDRAIEAVRSMAENDRSKAVIMYDLAKALCGIGQFEKAEVWFKKILKWGPNASVYNQLAIVYKNQGHLSKTVEYLKKGIQTDPTYVSLWGNLGVDLIQTGQIEEAIAASRKAVEMSPGNAVFHSNLLFNMHYLIDIDFQALFNEHKRWGQIHAPANKAGTIHDNNPDPDRRLRIGYVSPDFREHSVASFFEPLLDGHNRKVVEVYGYGNVERPDNVTRRLRGKFDDYRNIRGTEDEKAAKLIEADKIDILVDLAGHTAGNRLSVLARRPAPIQVTYLGYPDTTGTEQVDYRLTDKWADSPESEKFCTEELIYLPEGFLCYRPAYHTSVVSELPANKNGYVTFGSFNNNCKINPFIIGLWAKILKNNDNSRLLLKFKAGGDQEVREHYYHQFELFGISRDRVEIHGWKRQVEYLELYRNMDIALDTYPYNGTTTTCEAMWMGVPTISLTGKHHVSRVGLSILSGIGLEFFTASTPQEYIAKATALATKPEALAKIRGSMRQRMLASPLCDVKAFACGVEDAYRKMWHKWCKSWDMSEDYQPAKELNIY